MREVGTDALREAAHGQVQPPPLPLRTRLAFGFGAVAYGVKDNGFAYFLLLFYSQVVGLDARLVGLAITLVLVLDALSDPVVGTWSDNLRSRWGRRHPFMYASALPVAVAFWFLWNPPAWSHAALFWYLLVLAAIIRTAVTFYEVPSSALAPELTQDYDERSSLIGWRYYFGWTGGNAMSVLMFAAIFPAFATAAIPDGRFNAEAYGFYGSIAAVLIFTAILVSAVGTHGRIPHLMPPPPQRRLTPGRLFREILETLSSRSFAALFVATIFGAIATGLAAALAFYINIYFWRFSSGQIAMLTIGIFLSAVIGSVVAPLVGRRFGKRRGAIAVGLVAFLGAPLPMVLRLVGVLPSPVEAPWVFWLVAAATVIDVGLII
ncbi:MAG: MFS transporter, partial [Sphingomonadaceae bacterium]